VGRVRGTPVIRDCHFSRAEEKLSDQDKEENAVFHIYGEGERVGIRDGVDFSLL